MPTSPLWAARVSAVIGVLQDSDKMLIDRATLENLLGIKKTEAWTLMRRWGAFQVGTSLVLRREDLLQALRELAEPNHRSGQRERTRGKPR
jgi:hypothetical protein